MPRPPHCRRIEKTPAFTDFKPVGVPIGALETVVMTLDEFEALRLADFLGLYQEESAQRMGVSRPTFSRIVDSARRKVAQALVLGRRLRVEGGMVAEGEKIFCPRGRRGGCSRCRFAGWNLQPQDGCTPQGETK